MNVVVVVCDTLRMDDFGCYGNAEIRTPNFDRMAEEGALFQRFYSEGLPTIPTRTSYFTGRYTLPFRPWKRLEPDDVLLAEMLWDKDYLSALVTDTYHMHKPTMGFGRGFDHVEWIRGREGDPYMLDASIKVDIDKYYQDPIDGRIVNQWGTRDILEQYQRNRAPWKAENGWKNEDDHFDAQVVRKGIRWLDEQVSRGRKDRLLLWLDIFAPHDPIDPPPPYDHMYTRDYPGKDLIMPMVREVEGYIDEADLEHTRRLRWGFITFIDRWVGILVEWLKEKEMLDNTFFVWTTDHGDFFGEHGIIEKCRPWPYDILSHIPMVIRHPQGMGKGLSVDAFVQTPDLTTTILDVLDVPMPDHIQGKSLIPLLSGREKDLHDAAISGWHGSAWSIRDRDWSYYSWLGGSEDLEHMEKPHRVELYNLKNDPGETRNVIGAHRDTAAAMDNRLLARMKELAEG